MAALAARPVAEDPPPNADLARAACGVMVRVRQLESTGDDRDTALETALEEFCLRLTDMPDGVARRLLAAAMLRMSIKASVGVHGVAYTVAMLIDMTDNLAGTGMTGTIN